MIAPMTHPGPIMQPPRSVAALAWKGTNSAAKYSGTKFPAGSCVRLYKRRWENPRPEPEIVRVSYVSEMNHGVAPFLIAITAE